MLGRPCRGCVSTWSMLSRCSTHVQHHRIAVRLDERGDAVASARRSCVLREEVVHLARASPGTTAGCGRGRRPSARAMRVSVRPTPEVMQVGVVAEPVRFGDDDLRGRRAPAARRRRGRSCTAPSSRASRSTRSQSSVASSSVGAREVDRVVAEHAVQRAAVGQLRQQPQRRSRRSAAPMRHVSRISSQPLLRRASRRTPCTSRAGPSASNACSRSATISSTRALAVAALQDLAGAAVQLHHAFRIQQHVRVLRRLPLQAEAARDRGPARRRRGSAFTPRRRRSAAPSRRSSPTARRA